MATSTSKPGAQIEPFEGWAPNCKYGLQRIDETDAGRLVRLEDVAIWLAEKWPRDRVIQRIFGPLIAGEGVEAGCLYVLNARTFAVPLTDGDRPNRAADEFWQYLPFVESNTLPEFVARDVAEAWDDCWPGLADPSTDMGWYMQRIIQANRERNALAKLLQANEVPAANSVSFDAESKRLQMERLRKLAIPVPKAHALWGWGRAVVPTTAVLSLVPDATAEPAPSASEGVEIDVTRLADLAEVVAYRAANMVKHGQGTRGPDWAIGNQLEVLGAALESELAKNGGKKVVARAAVGKLLGCSGENVRQALKSERKKTSPLPSVPSWRAAGGRR